MPWQCMDSDNAVNELEKASHFCRAYPDSYSQH